MNTTLLGRWGEALCAEYLRKKKYKLVAVNYHSRFGEIDLIAETKTHIVFCEVKLRKNDRYAKAYEYVTASKQRKIKTTAQIWLSQHATEKYVRFDVFEVYAPDGVSGNYEINHIESAF